MRAATALLAAAAALTGLCGEGGKIPWRSDLSSSQRRAKQEGRKLLLYFCDAQSARCRELGKEALSDDAVASAALPFECVMVDTGPYAIQVDPINLYGIRKVPVLVLADAGSGREIDRLDPFPDDGKEAGGGSPPDIAGWLRRHAEPEAGKGKGRKAPKKKAGKGKGRT